MSAAALLPASTSRTAMVTVAPARASERAVSRPMPEAPPVTRALRPERSTPLSTSSAVDPKPKGVLMVELIGLEPNDVVGVESALRFFERDPQATWTSRPQNFEP